MPRLEQPPVTSAVGARRAPAQHTYQEVIDEFRSPNGSKVLRMMFPTKREQDRFLSVVFSLLARQTDVLERATPMSIVDAIKTAAAMGLEPGTADGSLVVYGTTATFLPQYQGYLRRIRNSGYVQDVDCQLVYENDEFQLQFGTDPSIYHKPDLTERGSYRGVYAWALMNSGLKIIDYMTVAEVDAIRDQYGNKRGGAWLTAYGEMARKTVIRRLSKRLPQDAVRGLLVADSIADDLQATVRTVQDDMAGVRALALRAVGQAPDPTTPPVQGSGPSAADVVPQAGEEGGPQATPSE